jgi:hypothetical protein
MARLLPYIKATALMFSDLKNPNQARIIQQNGEVTL